MKAIAREWIRKTWAPLVVIVTITVAGSAMITASHLFVEHEILLQVVPRVTAGQRFALRVLLLRGETSALPLVGQDVRVEVDGRADSVVAARGVADFTATAPTHDFEVAIEAAGIRMSRHIQVGSYALPSMARTGAFRHSFSRERNDGAVDIRFESGLCSDGSGQCAMLLRSNAERAAPQVVFADQTVECSQETREQARYQRCTFCVAPPHESVRVNDEIVALPIAYATPSFRRLHNGFAISPSVGSDEVRVQLFAVRDGSETWLRTKTYVATADAPSLFVADAELANVSRLQLQPSAFSEDNQLIILNPLQRSLAQRFALAEQELRLLQLPAMSSSRPQQQAELVTHQARVRAVAYFSLFVGALAIAIWLWDFWREAARTRAKVTADWLAEEQEGDPSSVRGMWIAAFAIVALLLSGVSVLLVQIH